MTTIYTQSEIRSVLHALNIKVCSTMTDDFLCLCPFHANHNTPSFEVNFQTGLYFCFNPVCSSRGNLVDLVQETSRRNYYEAVRFIQTHKGKDNGFDDYLADILDEKPDFVEFPANTLQRLSEALWQNERARGYFLSRGINEDSMRTFNLGYSEGQDMVTVPLTAPDGMSVGIIGRSIEDKRFKNSTDLPRNKTLFNLSSAKKHGGKIIVCESSFDAILIAQAGFPNVVATLGAHLSKEQIQLLNRYSSTIIIMTDNDEAGRKLGNNIAKNLNNKNLLWSSYNYDTIYPHGAKDAGDLTPEEIRQCIINAIPHYEYALV